MLHAGSSLDHYAVLSISRDAPLEVVRAAWRALCWAHHPDRNPGDAATARIAEINGAYEILSNPRTRAEYDNSLERDKDSDALRRLTAPEPVRDRWWQSRHSRLVLAATVVLLLAVLAAIGTYAGDRKGTVSETAWMQAAVEAAEGRAPPRPIPPDAGTVLRISRTLSEMPPVLRLAVRDVDSIAGSGDEE